MTYEQKVAHAINLLQSIPQDGPIEIAYSGGKDSDVILELAKMAGINYEAVYQRGRRNYHPSREDFLPAYP